MLTGLASRTSRKVIYYAVVSYPSSRSGYAGLSSQNGRYQSNQEQHTGETFDYERPVTVWLRPAHRHSWCIILLLTSYNLGSLPSVTDPTKAEIDRVNRALASLILNVVQLSFTGLISPVLNKFLTDFVKDGDKIIIQTYYPEGSANGLAASKEYSARFHFDNSKLEVRLLFS